VPNAANSSDVLTEFAGWQFVLIANQRVDFNVKETDFASHTKINAIGRA